MTKTLEAAPTTTAPTNGASKRRILSKSSILAAKPLTFTDVPTDEWEEGSAVRVKAMDYDTRETWELAVVALDDDKTGEAFRGVRLKAVARCIVDDKGERQFTDADLTALSALDARPIQRCWEAILKLSRNDSLDTQVEAAAKN